MSSKNAGRAARLSALAIAALSAPVLMASSAGAATVLGPCSATRAGRTITLQADCTTTAAIPVSDGVTVDGNGFSITAVVRGPGGRVLLRGGAGGTGPPR